MIFECAGDRADIVPLMHQDLEERLAALNA